MNENITKGNDLITIDDLMNICESSETKYSQSFIGKAGDIQDAIANVSNEIDDMIEDITRFAMRHAIQNLMDDGYVVSPKGNGMVTQEQLRKKEVEASVKARHGMVFTIAAWVGDRVNEVLFRITKSVEQGDYVEAGNSEIEKDAYLNVLYFLNRLSSNFTVNRQLDDENRLIKIGVVSTTEADM